jgi:rhodanese-related sulfurtransferase
MPRTASTEPATMRLIQRDDLKASLDRGDAITLVMVLGEWFYRAKHIPGSININTPDEALRRLRPEDDIVVYSSTPECPASIYAYKLLTSHGYARVRRYAGGLQDWEGAGYPLAGEAIGWPSDDGARV